MQKNDVIYNEWGVFTLGMVYHIRTLFLVNIPINKNS